MKPATGNAPGDRIEHLLADVVALPESLQEAALLRLCAAEPALVEDLRARYALFRRLERCTVTAEPTADTPQQFGEYELVRELGRGGMGVVYLARQRRGEQQRFVALKLVRDRLALSPQARERLRREGAAAFRLDHPGICQALDVGEFDGTPFVTMRYVQGTTLAALIAVARNDGRLPELPVDPGHEGSSTGSTGPGDGIGDVRVRSIVALIEQVARALHAAHEAGFVHRDVKPGNVMVTPEGAPVLLDFGLVHDEASTHGLTLTGQPLGTPAYMSPEQIEPDGRSIDRTTDVYSLGATLFESLAGAPPFAAATREELFRQILTHKAPDLRRLAPGVSRDLRIVVETALDKEPERRYPTAQAFGDDLRRARLAQPILARPPSPGRRLLLWTRRNPLPAAVLALLLVAQVVIVVLALQAEHRSEEAVQAQTAAREAQLRAEADFAAARDAIAELTEVARQHLADVPWLEVVRRELFQKALTFHDQVASRRASSPALRLQAAIARVQAASLQADLGDATGARQLLEVAVGDLGPLAAASPIATHWLAFAQLQIAQVQESRADQRLAEQAYRQVIRTLEELGQRQPLTGGEKITLATGRRRLSAMVESVGRRGEALALADQAIAAIDGVTDPNAPIERASALRLRACLQRNAGDHVAAAADFAAACALLREVVRTRPQDSQAMAGLGTTLVSLGVMQADRGATPAAIEAYVEAHQVFETLVAAFPYSVAHRTNLSNVLSNLANQQRRSGLEGEARATLQRSIEIDEELLRGDPHNIDLQGRLAACSSNLANQVKSDDPERAIELDRRALALIEGKLAANADDREGNDVAFRIASTLGGMLATRGQDRGAIAAFERARVFGERLCRARGNDARSRRNLAMLAFNEGSLACEMGDLEAAVARLQQAVAIDQSLVADSPDDARACALLLSRRLRLAVVRQLRDGENAIDDWQLAMATMTRLPAPVRQKLEQDPNARFDLACICRGMAACRLRAGDTEAAENLLQQAATLLRPGPELPIQVERLLLARDQGNVALQRADATAAAAAVVEVAALARGITPRIAQSRLQLARVRAALGALEEFAERAGDADQRAAVQALRATATR